MSSAPKEKKVLVLHGPNLNMLGLREPEVYGHTRLGEINAQLDALGKKWGISILTFQSNHEGALVDRIQEAVQQPVDGIIINPAAFTHTSIALRDALLALKVPIIEVHISNIHRREPFRHHSMIADIATGQLVGLGINGYYLALRAMADIIGATTPD